MIIPPNSKLLFYLYNNLFLVFVVHRNLNVFNSF